MKINGISYRSVWRPSDDDRSIRIFDQTRFPWTVEILELRDAGAVADAITTMQVRGAPLIGAVAAYGLVFALQDDASDAGLNQAADMLIATRPTAINLRWAIERMVARLESVPAPERVTAGYAEADAICDEDVQVNEAIGRHGLDLIREIWERKGRQGQVNLLTHCNAGWIATVDWGTALAPIYMAHDEGIPVHVWVDETRPRNQGSLLTAWELGSHGVPHTVIADNAGGHYMQAGRVDMVIVGTDRVTAQGDVANKIGTYLKALAAQDNNVPFWVALPSSTIDWRVRDGVKEIPIEERSGDEVLFMTGLDADGNADRVRIAPVGSPAANPAFDVTPARLVSGLITERGRCEASETGLRTLFPDTP
ncbi:S-methyl-5-thioribose-1-phosphate isomerase [Gluconobacter kanchanaburiensis]|uniref:Methylthioribose-1-phosphate isomerase n=1 Tax=Gluconobacter kanchanaburiensis NBRC 103587 TaxID=1307948 RepID=A0A511B521_9PROT|nr:S-methyl-5-thioribose-1-phosphate isomerase [Gluconobacter kanchanaburiensis]MBF0861008.1 S-methyl-5-thioribose-1-phosphate isomerase [Gluconobacter kanchanaburiensis]GBR70212.1 methylthioribose-1-phosphate isomerase [Gluconobacter kanchanaburiensis NBRC 103587]GEK94812.1 methylthioribose-1-phosphate isomerase [Gluconobacter kanchanaburiensis NBRC 103587]